MFKQIINRAFAASVVGCCLILVAGCGDSNPGKAVSATEAEQQSKLTEQGIKSAPATDEASRQNQLTGGGSAGQTTGGK